MSKTVYEFQSKDLTLKNSKGDNIVISTGDTLVFNPAYKKSAPVDFYEVTLSHKDKKDISFKSDAELVKRLFQSSNKKIITQDLQIFKIDDNMEQYEALMKKALVHLELFISKIKTVDLSANSLEITKHAKVLSSHLESLEEVNFSQLSKPQKEAVNFFNQAPKDLELTKENVKIQASPYTYMYKLEDFANDTISSAGECLTELDPSQASSNINDFIDILNIPSLINKGRLKEAYDATSLDTYVREGLPSDFWNDWVCEVGNDKSILNSQEELFRKPQSKKKKM